MGFILTLKQRHVNKYVISNRNYKHGSTIEHLSKFPKFYINVQMQ